MGNGASRLFNIMKQTSENTNTIPSEIVSLTVKSIQPLIFSRDDRLEIPEEFCMFGQLISKEDLIVGDIVTAMVFNEGQTYFIEQKKGASIIDLLYPVGSIYMSVNQTNPAILFGGTWRQIKDKFLLASGDVYSNGDTGGEATHELTIDEMPAHTHNSKELIGQVWNTAVQSNVTGISTSGIASRVDSSSGSVGYATVQGTGSATYTDAFNIDATHEHDSVGSSKAHNNMPPYLVINIWERIS